MNFKRVFLLLCSALPLQASLVTVVNDYGTGANQPFDPTFGNTVSASGTVYSPSFAFTVPGTINLALSQIVFTASLVSAGGVNSVTASIETNNGGVPGLQIYTTGAVTGQMGVLSSNTKPPVTVDYSTVGAGTTLIAGATYWLTLTAPSNSQIAWNANGAGTTGTEEYLQNGTWTSASKELSAFEIIGATPEPGTWTLLVLGMGLLVAGRRRLLNN